MREAILAIDTAGARCSAALVDGTGRVLALRQPEIGRGHAEALMGLIAEVLAEAGGAYRDLGRIAVTIGPGSFTGLRVGVAAARGLSLALGVPAVGVSTLRALAEPHRGAGSILAVADAKRGELYAALYGPGGETLFPAAAVPVEDLASRLAPAAPPAAICGSGAAIAAEGLGLAGVPLLDVEGHVDILAVARLGAAAAPGEAPRPLYLRGPDAKPQGNRSLRLVGAGSPPALPSRALPEILMRD